MSEKEVEKYLTEDGFGVDFRPLPEAESYYPTRLEYFAGKALQGLVTGRAEKDLRTAVRRSLALAIEMEQLIDDSEAS